MNQSGFQNIQFVLVFFFFMLLRIDFQGQTMPESERNDSTHRIITEEGGKNYAPAYYYYIQSLFPTTIEHTLIDTTVFKPYNEDVSLFSRNLYANLGIFGQANFSMNFSFYRKHGFSYKTLPYNTYLRTIENWKLFLPEGVYTNIQYNFSNGKENHFSVTHAQKIYDNLHLDLGIESIIAEGRYLRQKIRDVNVGASLRYNLPSNRYGFAAYYFLNLIKNQENGGIAADSLFEQGTKTASSINVRFSEAIKANNHLFQNTFFFRHYLSLSRTKKEEDSTSTNKIRNKNGYLVHDIEYGSSKNIFDAMVGKDTLHSFPIFNFNADTTRDLVKTSQLRNAIFWSSFMPEDTLPDRKHFIRFAAGIAHTFVYVEDTLMKFRDHQLTPLGVLHLKLFNRLHIKANGQVTLNGYNAGDLTIDGKMILDFFHKETIKHEIQVKVGFYNYSPDYFFSHLTANNYSWEKDLQKQQTIMAGIAWEHNHYSVGLNYYTLNKYTLLNENCQPEQIEHFANVYQFAAYIPFHIKGFGFNSNIYAQYTDNKKIKIPIFAVRQTVYYGFSLFKKALYLQLGVDLLYNTAYYANAYNPVLQQFYMQENKQIGNYPYLDVYLRAKINRFQLQVKGTHLLAGLLGYNYYLVPHYPAKDRGFALGVLWSFYD